MPSCPAGIAVSNHALITCRKRCGTGVRYSVLDGADSPPATKPCSWWRTYAEETRTGSVNWWRLRHFRRWLAFTLFNCSGIAARRWIRPNRSAMRHGSIQ